MTHERTGATVLPFGRQGRPDTQPLDRLVRRWEARRRGRLVPRRADLGPAVLDDDGLDRVFLVDPPRMGHARLRLTCDGVNDLLGMDVRGMPLSAIFVPTARARLEAAVDEVFARPALCRLDLADSIGPASVAAAMVLLPVAGPGGGIKALGALATAEAAPAPRRFRILSVDLRPLGATAISA
ncbi:PAS domain-containing protein [Rhodobacteraceae bacterium CCMM004]|nr:PAS domain-containing protein [Rhodobacteraceae bacterium CCMM004]